MDVELECSTCSLQYQHPLFNKVSTILSCGHAVCGYCADVCCPICNAQVAGKCVTRRQKLVFDIHMKTLLTKLHDGFTKQQTAADHALHDKRKLLASVDASIEYFQNDIAVLITRAIDCSSNAIAIARAVCAERVKILDAQADELMVSAGQISACLKATTKSLDHQRSDEIPHLVQYASAVQKLGDVSTRSRVPTTLAIMSSTTPLLQELYGMTKLWLYDVDSKKSSVTGNGLLYATFDVNTIEVWCRDSDGKLAEWISEQDVLIRVTNFEGSCVGRQTDTKVVETGLVQVQYVVDDRSVKELLLHVSVRDTSLCDTPWKVGVLGLGQIRVDARPLKTSELHETGRHSLAVTQDGQYFIVSNESDHGLSVYSMESGRCIRKFGEKGLEPGQFNGPYRICATPNGTLLVAEYANKRIQEVTLTGEHVRFFGIGQLGNGSFFSICIQGDIVAVGKYEMSAEERIFLFNYSSGALIRKFGSCGGDEGKTTYITGLSISPDGKRLLVCEYASRLTLFSVDGTFITTIGAGLCGTGFKDVLYLDSCIFVADSDKHFIRVFSSKTGGLLQVWGSQGDTDRQFYYPSALAVHKNKLLVLDSCRTLVRILE